MKFNFKQLFSTAFALLLFSVVGPVAKADLNSFNEEFLSHNDRGNGNYELTYRVASNVYGRSQVDLWNMFQLPQMHYGQYVRSVTVNARDVNCFDHRARVSLAVNNWETQEARTLGRYTSTHTLFLENGYKVGQNLRNLQLFTGPTSEHYTNCEIYIESISIQLNRSCNDRPCDPPPPPCGSRCGNSCDKKCGYYFYGEVEGRSVQFEGYNHDELFSNCMRSLSYDSNGRQIDDIKVYGRSYRNGPSYWSNTEVCSVAALNARAREDRNSKLILDALVDGLPVLYTNDYYLSAEQKNSTLRRYATHLIPSDGLRSYTVWGEAKYKNYGKWTHWEILNRLESAAKSY